MRHAVRALVASLIVAAGTAGMIVARPSDDPAAAAPGLRAGALPSALEHVPAPRIRLRDAAGGRFDSRELAGGPYLVTFVYARCRDVCPLIGFNVAAALERLGRRADEVAALAVSVDPRGDTPRAARRWLVRHQLRERAHYLVGTAAELIPVWRDWYVVGERQRRLDPVAHAAAVWLVDARGRLRGRWAPDTPLDPADLAHDLAKLADEAPAA